MNLLGIDTSSNRTVLGLDLNGEIVDRTSEPVKTHSRDVLPAIERMLTDSNVALSDLDAIVFGQGPGSFTGLRISVGVVQGLAYGLQIPVVPVSSLACLAQSIYDDSLAAAKVFTSLHARANELYCGAYQFVDGVARIYRAERVVAISDLELVEAGRWLAIGDCWQFKGEIETHLGVEFESVTDNATPAITSLLHLGQVAYQQGRTVSALAAQPVYLRETVANKPGESA